MSKLPWHSRFLVVVCVALAAGFAACEDETEPGPVPVDVEIVSGDGQYSKLGTELEDPVVAQVTLSDGEPGAGVVVSFSVKSGGGNVSQSAVAADGNGRAGTRWTLGPALGTQELTISISGDAAVATVAEATAATFFCPEEDPTFVRRFNTQGDVFLFTRFSSVVAGGGAARAGVAHVVPVTPDEEFSASSLVGFDETFIQSVVRDCAFAGNGEFYIAWTSTSSVREIAKIAPNRAVTHFATLDGILGTEITWLENGVLAGCDEFGPFTVGCRDSLTRYADAVFDGTTTQANHDAVAYDEVGNYLYFIDKTARRLKRVPLDGYAQTNPTEEAAVLTVDEAEGTNGMVAHEGTVYMLVESPPTKAIVSVTSTGTKATLFDFNSRGAGDAAGIQDDLALRVQGALVALYTLDTLNDVVLMYVIEPAPSMLLELVPDAGTAADAVSRTGTSGERVGLASLP